MSTGVGCKKRADGMPSNTQQYFMNNLHHGTSEEQQPQCWCLKAKSVPHADDGQACDYA